MTAPAGADAAKSALSAGNATVIAASAGAATLDRIAHLKLSSITLPLADPISDAKVLTGRQKPMTEVAFLFVEVVTSEGRTGVGFSYSKRAGGPGQFAHAKEIAEVLVGEDPSDIGKLWTKLCWAGASVGRSGLATQAIAAFDVALWDLKAKRAGLPLSKLLGSYRDSVRTYNTSGGFLHTPIEQVKENAAASLAEGIGAIKLKVGQPDWRLDVARVAAVREFLDDDVPLMVDANQQWDRATAMRMGRIFEEFGLVWIEEPLDAYDAEGHAALARALDTPIATGEMLASVAEHARLIEVGAADIVQPDAPGSAASPSSSDLRRSPSPSNWRSRPISPWRSTVTSPRPIRSSPGSSTSTGSIRCSTNIWRPGTAVCGYLAAQVSASPSVNKLVPGRSAPQNSGIAPERMAESASPEPRIDRVNGLTESTG